MTTSALNKQAFRRWLPLLLLAPFQFIFGLIYSWGAISPAIHTQSGWSQASLDLTFSLTPLALLPAVVSAGHGLQRLSPKTMLAVALGCFTIGGGTSLAFPTPVPFMLGYGILALGIGAGLSTAACIAIVARLYPEHRGAPGGALLALYGMSSVVSAPIFEWLNGHFGWRTALAGLLGAYAVLGWSAWVGLPDLPLQKSSNATHSNLRTSFSHRPLRQALLLVLLAAPLGSASFATAGHLVHELGFGTAFTLAAVTSMAVGNGLGRLGFGVLADLRSARFARNTVLTLNALAAALLLALLHGVDDRMFVPFPLLIGLAFGGMAGKLPALAAHVAGNTCAGTAFGLLFGAFALASFLGPLACATLGMHTALHGFAISALLAGLLTRAVP